MPVSRNEYSYPVVVVTDPASPHEMIVGEPVALGLFQDWTLLGATLTDRGEDREGVFVAVRPHRYHPFVTERFGFRADDGAFVVWSGTYHETLADALASFAERGGKIDIRIDRPDNYIENGMRPGSYGDSAADPVTTMEATADFPVDHLEGE